MRPGTLPAGACDCHIHVFGPAVRYPFAAGRAYTPPEASFESYRTLVLERLGLGRIVLVQPSVYGTDNRAMLDAMANAGNGGGPAVRGVAAIGGEEESELAVLNAAGVRGVRVNRLFPGSEEIDDLDQLAARIAPYGWHLQLLIDVAEDPGAVERLARLPVPVVINHLGHMPATLGRDHPGFRALLGLLRDGRAWAKLSAPYRLSAQDEPPYDDVRPLAEAILAAAPDRVVWGSDWPHPALSKPPPRPENLLDPLFDWIGDEDLRHRILVDNPARLYGFA